MGPAHEAIAPDIYYIVPGKCTECVGFFDHEECAAACPVDCCVPDPQIPEVEAVLIERARRLHPEITFEADLPVTLSQVTRNVAPVFLVIQIRMDS